MVKPRFLWVGDAVAPTGFSRVTHALCDRLRDAFDIVIYGLNFRGALHPHNYTILKAASATDLYKLIGIQVA
jgi:hypothetical protein